MFALAAATSELVFIAIRLRTGSLWMAIIYHALWDWALFMAGSTRVETDRVADVAAASGTALFLPFVVVLPNALYALWLLRRAGRQLPPGDPKAA